MRIGAWMGVALLHTDLQKRLRVASMQLTCLNIVHIFKLMKRLILQRTFSETNWQQNGWPEPPQLISTCQPWTLSPAGCYCRPTPMRTACPQCATHALTAKLSLSLLAHLRVAVAAARGEADVDAHHAPVARAVDARVLDGVPDHHALRARQHAQRLRQRAAVAPPFVLCAVLTRVRIRVRFRVTVCLSTMRCAPCSMRTASASAPQSHRRSSSVQGPPGLGLWLEMCLSPIFPADPFSVGVYNNPCCAV